MPRLRRKVCVNGRRATILQTEGIPEQAHSLRRLQGGQESATRSRWWQVFAAIQRRRRRRGAPRRRCSGKCASWGCRGWCVVLLTARHSHYQDVSASASACDSCDRGAPGAPLEGLLECLCSADPRGAPEIGASADTRVSGARWMAFDQHASKYSGSALGGL